MDLRSSLNLHFVLLALFAFLAAARHLQAEHPKLFNATQTRNGKCNRSKWILWNELKINKFFSVFSLFSVVRFSQSSCSGTNGYNGTCLTSSECKSQSGISAGTCAAGFGVCCTSKWFKYPRWELFFYSSLVTRFFILPFAWISSNHFDLRDYRFKKRHLLDEPAKFSAGLVLLCYWTVPTAYQQIEFQYLSDEVIEFARIALRSRIYDVQLHRLDFLKLILSGPDQNPRSATRCLNDIFLVTGASNSVPGICGTASGQHSNRMFINFNDKIRNFFLKWMQCTSTYQLAFRQFLWIFSLLEATTGTGAFKSFKFLVALLTQVISWTFEC